MGNRIIQEIVITRRIDLTDDGAFDEVTVEQTDNVSLIDGLGMLEYAKDDLKEQDEEEEDDEDLEDEPLDDPDEIKRVPTRSDSAKLKAVEPQTLDPDEEDDAPV